MVSNEHRRPWTGRQKELLCAIDVGTTFSGVAYSILEPGEIPNVYNVVGFKGQEDQPGNTKVPTVVFYDSQGELLACGAEGLEQFSEDDGCIKVEWFKFLLRLQLFDPFGNQLPRVTLPAGKTVVDVLADYLGYLKQCLQDYIITTHTDGSNLWAELGDQAQYIMTHPNGWGGHQQDQMRQAAVQAGFVPRTQEGLARIEFVTEGEASCHWCIDANVAKSSISTGSQIIVADCGGGTIDVSSYRVSSVLPLRLTETTGSECRLSGSVFVTEAFKRSLQHILKGSSYEKPEYIDRAAKEFDRKTKCLFRDREKMALIKIGTRNDDDPGYGISLGNLAVDGDVVAAAFETSCEDLCDAILAHRPSEQATVFLVGGFAASPWLYSEVKRRLGRSVADVRRGEMHLAKAASHGAIVYYLDRYITTRVAKYTYGIFINPVYCESNPEHLARKSQIYIDPVDGKTTLPGGFATIIKKGTEINDRKAYRKRTYKVQKKQRPYTITLKLQRYTGTHEDLQFVDMDSPFTLREVCRFKTTIPASAAVKVEGPNGVFWKTRYRVSVSHGATLPQCWIDWVENGEVRESLAEPLWEDL